MRATRCSRCCAVAADALRASLLAGAGGTLAITASTTLEMRLRGRPASQVPVETVERVLGRKLGPRVRKVAGTAAHLASGLALGPPRVLLASTGVREPAATLLFGLLASAPDVVIVPALGVTEPPWRWGATELAISLAHHLAYAAGASAGLALSR
jgi:hypothetical protein